MRKSSISKEYMVEVGFTSKYSLEHGKKGKWVKTSDRLCYYDSSRGSRRGMTDPLCQLLVDVV